MDAVLFLSGLAPFAVKLYFFLRVLGVLGGEALAVEKVLGLALRLSTSG